MTARRTVGRVAQVAAIVLGASALGFVASRANDDPPPTTTTTTSVTPTTTLPSTTTTLPSRWRCDWEGDAYESAWLCTQEVIPQ